MLNLKSFVIFSVDLLSRGGEFLSCPTHHCQFPSLEEIFPCLEQHFGMVVTTFAFSVQIMAGIYGLKEYTKEGSGIRFSSMIFEEPWGYSLSYLVYCV